MRATAEQIAQWCSGVLVGAPNNLVTHISWDSRAVEPGALYVALRGEHVDGHDFVCDAAYRGARCVLVTEALSSETQRELLTRNVAVIQVADAYSALGALASAWRLSIGARVIGVTGSNGKTTTKNLIRDVLAARFSVVATQANQNNELGVPATLLAAEKDTQFVVVEMGMRGSGQIASLCEFVHPDWGLVTNVGQSHIELLGSHEAIAQAKSELIAALPAGGYAFLNAADTMSEYVWHHAAGKARGVCRVDFNASGEGNQGEGAPTESASSESVPREGALTKACESALHVWAEQVSLDECGHARFTLCSQGFSHEVQRAACALSLVGIHNVSNACAAAAVGLAAGIDIEAVAHALSAAQPTSARQEIIGTPGGFTIINDAYNANPDSMCAAFSTFAALHTEGRRIAVLGDMGELGTYAVAEHERVGRELAKLTPDMLICVGALARNIAEGAHAGGMNEAVISCVDTADEAMVLVKKLVAPHDLVLLKASHSVGLESVVEGLVGKQC